MNFERRIYSTKPGEWPKMVSVKPVGPFKRYAARRCHSQKGSPYSVLITNVGTA